MNSNYVKSIDQCSERPLTDQLSCPVSCSFKRLWGKCYEYIYTYKYIYIYIYIFKFKATKFRNVCRLNEN